MSTREDVDEAAIKRDRFVLEREDRRSGCVCERDGRV